MSDGRNDNDILDMIDISDFSDINFDCYKYIDTQVNKSLLHDQNNSELSPHPKELLFGSISTSLQFKAQELTETLEVVSNQIINILPSFLVDINKIRQQLYYNNDSVSTLQLQVSQVDSSQQESLQSLGEIDLLKSKLISVKDVLTEVSQWDIRIKEMDALLASGSLSQVYTLLNKLKYTANILSNIPEFYQKTKCLDKYYNQLINVCKTKCESLLTSYSIKESEVCIDVLKQINMSHRMHVWLSHEFKSICQRQWNILWMYTNQGSIDAQTHTHTHADTDTHTHISEDTALVKFFQFLSNFLQESSGVLQAVSSTT
eukprot:GHVR01006739.1.p1 GENE.GHVR01006739.1~~GHVR01006739.1.p1  ORF type:complete len:317 (+),score=80.79 GHVR01006739.1:35-985(+)